MYKNKNILRKDYFSHYYTEYTQNIKEWWVGGYCFAPLLLTRYRVGHSN